MVELVNYINDPTVGIVAEDTGFVESATGTTLVDSSKAWEVNWFTGGLVKIIAGTGAGQVRKITSNTATQLTITNAWATIPDETSQYVLASDWSSRPDAEGTAGQGVQAVAMMMFDGTNMRSVRTYTIDSAANNNVPNSGMICRSDQGAVNDRFKSDIGSKQVGTVNTQLQVVQTTYNCKELAIIAQASGGNFASQGMTIEVSVNNVDFIQVDSINLGTAAIKSVQYDNTHLASGTGTAVNPADFRYVRITVPAIAAVTVTLTIAGKH